MKERPRKCDTCVPAKTPDSNEDPELDEFVLKHIIHNANHMLIQSVRKMVNVFLST